MNNEDKYWEVLSKLDPDLYLIKVALVETGLNPRIMPRIIRSIANLAYGDGYGKVQVFMEKKVITSVKGEEWDKLDLPAMEDNEGR